MVRSATVKDGHLVATILSGKEDRTEKGREKQQNGKGSASRVIVPM